MTAGTANTSNANASNENNNIAATTIRNSGNDLHSSSTLSQIGSSQITYKEKVEYLLQSCSPDDVVYLEDMLEAFEGQEGDLLGFLSEVSGREVVDVLSDIEEEPSSNFTSGLSSRRQDRINTVAENSDLAGL